MSLTTHLHMKWVRNHKSIVWEKGSFATSEKYILGLRYYNGNIASIESGINKHC
jgi:hypothetical protein